MNLLVNAGPVAVTGPAFFARAGHAGSIADFIQLLRDIGARPAALYTHHDPDHPGSEEIQTLFASCSRETWERGFGRPENIVDHHALGTNMPVQTWDQQCSDGRVKCIGHLFQRFSGDSWVILARIAVPL